jgi:CRP-like cAMP-binding protein
MANILKLESVQFTNGAYVVIEGKRNVDRFYIVHEGRLRIFNNIETVQQKKQNVLSAGDFFSVVPMMSGMPEIETVQAISDVTLIEVRRDQFDDMVRYAEPVVLKILTQLSARTRSLLESLDKKSEQDTSEAGQPPAAPIIEKDEAFFRVGEFFEQHDRHNHAYFVYHKYLSQFPEGRFFEEAERKHSLLKERFAHMAPPFDRVNQTRRLPKGAIIFAQGSPDNNLYVVNEGSVRLTRIQNDSEVLIGRLKQGDIFGEMAFLENKVHLISAFAAEDVCLMIIDSEQFFRINQQNPQIVSKFMSSLCERVWYWYKQLLNRALPDPVAKIYDMVTIQLEKDRVSPDVKSYALHMTGQELLNMIDIPIETSAVHWQAVLKEAIITLQDTGYINVEDVRAVMRRSNVHWKHFLEKSTK